MPPAAHPRYTSTYPAPEFPRTSPGSEPDPAFPEAGNRTLALPLDSLQIVTQTATPLLLGSHGFPARSSIPTYAPPATELLPPPRRPEPAIPLAPLTASPGTHWPAPAHAADYCGTSPRSNARHRSASNAPALRPASS